MAIRLYTILVLSFACSCTVVTKADSVSDYNEAIKMSNPQHLYCEALVEYEKGNKAVATKVFKYESFRSCTLDIEVDDRSDGTIFKVIHNSPLNLSEDNKSTLFITKCYGQSSINPDTFKYQHQDCSISVRVTHTRILINPTEDYYDESNRIK